MQIESRREKSSPRMLQGFEWIFVADASFYSFLRQFCWSSRSSHNQRFLRHDSSFTGAPRGNTSHVSLCENILCILGNFEDVIYDRCIFRAIIFIFMLHLYLSVVQQLKIQIEEYFENRKHVPYIQFVYCSLFCFSIYILINTIINCLEFFLYFFAEFFANKEFWQS